MGRIESLWADWPSTPTWERVDTTTVDHVRYRWRCKAAGQDGYWELEDGYLMFWVTELDRFGRVRFGTHVQNDYDRSRREEGWALAESRGAPPRPTDWDHGCKD